ncbi:uncharacterized protein LOC129968417 [Argiope bruennichi]|uniref:uncharacterized protein LOC129968417 n=1 Tax=Argiope bruennichi TaxID=94029 RepID=UPI002493F8DB|nr:uncharacterized protein LOC129968417 [Argiope bruennichi]
MKLIPADLLLEYNKSEKQNSGSKIEELLSFITHALAAREKTQSINKTNKSCIELRNRRMEFKYQDRENKRINQKGISTATANELQQHIERKNLVQTGSTDLGNQSEGEVFLQTLVVYIKNGNCERLVRAILDTGSQKSYVSQHIAKTLGLKSLGKHKTKISDLWELDSLGIKDPSEKKTKLELQDFTLKHFENTVSQNEDGRYYVYIPWIDGHDKLSDNFQLAERRLKNTVRSLKGNGRLLDYEQVFFEWENEGIIERVNENDHDKNKKIHYLPHRPVFKENSTTKIRPVFDGSARHGHFCSLNSCIEPGPNLIEIIPAILNRFRLRKIGVISDIRKAFLQIALHENDRNFLRFLWWEGGDHEKLIIYRHCRVVFGVSCSPFLLAAVLNFHLKRAPEHLKAAAEKLLDSMYVDNCVTSVETFEEYLSFQRDSRELLALGNFDLRGWRHSNMHSPILEESIDQHDLYSPEVQVLGLLWNVERDTLSISFKEPVLEEGPVSKIKILSITHRIFDPIGVTCPVTLIPKLILQECWKMETSWDSPLPEDIEKKFEIWQHQLKDLKELEISRRLSHLDLKDASLSLEVVCDASKLAYATCAFLRVEKDGKVTCQLIQARSKVAPLKGISIPRLELLSCMIGARLADAIKRDLHLEDIESTFWSDSMDVLHWIKREGPWATFVANRVEEIRKLSSVENWRHVPGISNPADLPSRGCTVRTLIKSHWWEGPDWIKRSKEDWPKSAHFPNMEVVNSEKKKTIVTAFVLQLEEKYYHRFSSYVKIVRITAWLLRFLKNLKNGRNRRTVGPLNYDETKKAERILLKQVQLEAFYDENDKRLKSLQVIKDSEGILRVKTRIFFREDHRDFRLPIILPSDHPVVMTLIMYEHEHHGHFGVQMLMYHLRENYWILKSRKAIKKGIKSCIICNRFDAKPVFVQEGLLPHDRVRDAETFEIVGLDLAGPVILKEERKAWILILTCAVYRAVHLELLTSVSTENFLLGLRRFIARRGRPSVIYSDNSTNLKSAHRLLKEVDFEKLKNIEELSPISWTFIPPNAPWWGGFWERLIGLMKRILRRTLRKTSLNHEEMNTVLCDCERVMNSRPLTYVSKDAEDLEPLTPAMFLHNFRETGVPDLDLIEETKFNKRLAYRNRIQKALRKRFRSEYLGQLREIQKVKRETALCIGDIVLVEDNTKRLNWNLGRILKLFQGKDNRARVALVKTKFGSFLRPVQKLYPLEVSENDKPVEHNTNSPLISGANRRETFPISLDRKTSLIEPPDGLPLPSKESDCGTDMQPTMDSSPLLPNETSHPVLPDGTEKLEPR